MQTPTTHADAPLRDWALGYRLFCADYSPSSIAAELKCSRQAVNAMVTRGHWHAKKSRLLMSLAARGGQIDPANGYGTVMDHVATYLPDELEKLAERTSIAEQALTKERTSNAPDNSVICRLLNALDQLSERKRILLGVPLPGSKRPASPEKMARRGMVGSSDPSQVTDVQVTVEPARDVPAPPDAS